MSAGRATIRRRCRCMPIGALGPHPLINAESPFEIDGRDATSHFTDRGGE